MLSALLPVHSVPGSRTGHRAAAALLVVCLLAAGCAANSFRRGREAERLQDFDRAVVEYTKALRLHPDDMNVRLALDRTKLRASLEHFTRARRFAAAGKLDQALVEY